MRQARAGALPALCRSLPPLRGRVPPDGRRGGRLTNVRRLQAARGGDAHEEGSGMAERPPRRRHVLYAGLAGTPPPPAAAVEPKGRREARNLAVAGLSAAAIQIA